MTTTKEACEKYGIQNCHDCTDELCGDNLTESPEKELLRLRAWNKELCKQLGSPCYARGTKQSCDHKVVEAADDLMSYLEKTVPQEVDLVGSDIGAAGLRDRLQRLATALKERGK